MNEPEENKNPSSFDGVAEGGEIGIDLALDGVFAVGDLLGDAVGGILDGISIDI